MRLAPAVLAVASIGLAGCTMSAGTRRLPPTMLAPIGAPPARDASQGFADTFCSVLARVDPSGSTWGACSRWIETPGTARTLGPLPTGHRVLIVPGFMAQCVSDDLHAFQDGAEHLRAMGVDVTYVDTPGFGTCTANGAFIADHLERELASDPRPWVVVAYSKGAPDVMEALVQRPGLAAHVTGLVTVAGAVGGSRLVDVVPRPAVRLVARFGPRRCRDAQGAAGFDSLARATRQEFLRAHPEPLVPTHSLVAACDRAGTSRSLVPTWKTLRRIELVQDGQIVASEAVAPGSAYLGVARADHWAVAMPYATHAPGWRFWMDENRYPRAALLEALVRFAVAEAEEGDRSTQPG